MFGKKRSVKILPLLVFTVFLVQVHAIPFQQKLQPQQLKANTEIEDLNRDWVPKGINKNKNILQKNASETELVNTYSHHEEGDSGSIALDDRFKYDVEILENYENSNEEANEFEERFRGNALNVNLDTIFPEDIEVSVLPSVRQDRVVGYGLIVLGLVAVVLYMACALWRRNLNKRYGNRVLLATNYDNDDDYTQHNTAPSQ